MTLLLSLLTIAQDAGDHTTSLPTSGIFGFLAVVISACGGGGIFLIRQQARKLDGEAKKVREEAQKVSADAAQSLTDANSSFSRMMDENIKRFEQQMSELRQQARIKEAEALEAKAQLTLSEAALAREKVESAEWRHAHTNRLALEKGEWLQKERGYQQNIDSLQSRINELEIAVGPLRETGVLPDRRQSTPTAEEQEM